MDLKPYLADKDSLNQRLGRALTWIQTVLGERHVDARLRTYARRRGATFQETFDTVSPAFKTDLVGAYLYNAWALLNDPASYDTNVGARVIPTLVALGGRIDLIEATPGAAERLRHSARTRVEFEKTLFELLCAGLYAANGWKVAFVAADPRQRTHEFNATKEKLEVAAECKRLAKNSGYSERERSRWLILVKPLSEFFRKRPLPLIIDINFHEELTNIPDDYLARAVVPKLELATPGVIVDSKEATISIRYADPKLVMEEAEQKGIKANGSRINFLIFGEYDPGRTYHPWILGKPDERYPLFLRKIDFVAGVACSCDAQRAMEAKARDIRDRLAEAVEQLPDKTAGAVHLAVESYDGPVVEAIRQQRIGKSLAGFKTSKNLRVVSIHLLKFDSPPDEAWAVEETVTVTSFAPGAGATIEEHAASPYLLANRHAFTY